MWYTDSTYKLYSKIDMTEVNCLSLWCNAMTWNCDFWVIEYKIQKRHMIKTCTIVEN